MKIIKKFMLSLFIFISIFSFNYISTVHAAETNNQGELEEFTNSDSFSYNNNIYNIGDYASSIEDTTILFSSNCDLDIKMVVNGDDPIIKIIPKHLFMEPNTTTYVGKEYGFFIQTVSIESYIKNIVNYRSSVIVFNIVNDLDILGNNGDISFSVKNLFQLEFITIYKDTQFILRKTDSLDYSPITDNRKYDYTTDVDYFSNNEYCVCPLFDLNNNAITNAYYLSDISYGATLENTQNYNQADNEYNVNDDNGSFFIRSQYIYDAQYLVNGEVTNYTKEQIGDFTREFVASKIIEFIISTNFKKMDYIFPILEYGSSVAEIIQDSVETKEYDVTNNDFQVTSQYTSKNDQVSNYGGLCKTSIISFNGNNKYSLLYNMNNFSKVTYTLSESSSLNNNPEPTTIKNYIKLKVYDSKYNKISQGSCENSFNIRENEGTNIKYDNNKTFLLDHNCNKFVFNPMYTGQYDLIIKNDKFLKCSFAGEEYSGTFIKISRELRKDENYFLNIENISDERLIYDFNLSISNNSDNLKIYANDIRIVSLKQFEGFYNISTNSKLVNLKILDSNFNIIKENDINNNCFSLLKDNYCLIYNNTNSDVVIDLLVSNNFPELFENQLKSLTLNRGLNFYKFLCSNTNTYSFFINNNNSYQYDLNIYSNSDNLNKLTIFGDDYTNYSVNLIEGQTYYLGFNNTSDLTQLIDFKINYNKNVFDFYIDNQKVDRTIYLKQGQEFNLKVLYNGQDITKDVVYIDANGYITRLGNNWKIQNDAPTSKAYTNTFGIFNKANQIIDYISISIVPNFTFNISETIVDNNSQNTISWSLESSNNLNSATVYLDFIFQNGYSENHRFIFSKGNANGILDMPNFSSSKLLDGKSKDIFDIKIKRIFFEHHWSNNIDGIEETYTYRFDNTYPNEVSNVVKQISIEPITFNNYFNGGSGTQDDPYQIATEKQLDNIRKCDSLVRIDDTENNVLNSYFAIMNNINLTKKWNPIDIPMYSGKIYGYNNTTKKINNLSIEEIKSDLDVGFIRNIHGGSFEYITFDNVNINIFNSYNTSVSNIGTIAGSCSGHISHCDVLSGDINVGNVEDVESLNGAKFTNTGGLCGYGKFIDSCSNETSITSYGDIGGIAGYYWTGEMSKCFNFGYLTLLHNKTYLENDSQNKSLGGLIGYAVKANLYEVENFSYIAYVNSNIVHDRLLAPRMGFYIGYSENCYLDGLKIINRGGDCSDECDTGNLIIEKNYNKVVYDQTKFTKKFYGKINNN